MKKISIWTFFCLVTVFEAYSSEKLWEIAEQSLTDNVEEGYLTAGRHQFRTVWTRDFAFSVPGLLLTQHDDVVKKTLTLILKNKHPQVDILPRGLDSISPQLRVLKQILSFIREKIITIPLGKKLYPEYRDQYGNFAFDGNALIAIAVHQYYEATGDEQWFREQLPTIKKLLLFYSEKMHKGLITQPKFSDWQDSVERKGKTFYTNFLYQRAYSLYLSYFSELKLNELSEFRDRLTGKFWDPKALLFKSIESKKMYYSLEGNLLYLLWGWDESIKQELWKGLVNSTFFATYPALGTATFPNYPKTMKSYLNRLVGLKEYHDSAHWSWLYGLSLHSFSRSKKCEKAMELQNFLSDLAWRDGKIYEIYSSKAPHKPYKTWAYFSEWPFSWGSGLILQGIDSFKRFCQ